MILFIIRKQWDWWQSFYSLLDTASLPSPSLAKWTNLLEDFFKPWSNIPCLAVKSHHLKIAEISPIIIYNAWMFSFHLVEQGRLWRSLHILPLQQNDETPVRCIQFSWGKTNAFLDAQASLAPTPVRPSVSDTFGFLFCQCLWAFTKHQDDI